MGPVPWCWQAWWLVTSSPLKPSLSLSLRGGALPGGCRGAPDLIPGQGCLVSTPPDNIRLALKAPATRDRHLRKAFPAGVSQPQGRLATGIPLRVTAQGSGLGPRLGTKTGFEL